MSNFARGYGFSVAFLVIVACLLTSTGYSIPNLFDPANSLTYLLVGIVGGLVGGLIAGFFEIIEMIFHGDF